jgi:uncharacterized membrane protein
MKQAYFNKGRVETFSDGIFAIIVTLLVLEIKVPQIEHHGSVQELVIALKHLMPKIISWIISFLIVCVIWVNHHRLFEQFRVVTHGLFWLNANLLLWCSFIPFPTALMGDYVDNPVSLIAFGVILSFMAVSFYLIRRNVLNNSFILGENVDRSQFKKATRNSLIFGPVLYLAGAAASMIHPFVSLSIYAFIPLYFILQNFFTNTKAELN